MLSQDRYHLLNLARIELYVHLNLGNFLEKVSFVDSEVDSGRDVGYAD